MKEAGQKVALSGDGQFDSPGLSNSSYGIIYEFWFEHSMHIMHCHLDFSQNILATTYGALGLGRWKIMIIVLFYFYVGMW